MLLFLSGLALFMGVMYVLLACCPGLNIRVFVGGAPCYIVQLLP